MFNNIEIYADAFGRVKTSKCNICGAIVNHKEQGHHTKFHEALSVLSMMALPGLMPPESIPNDWEEIIHRLVVV